MTLVNFLNDSQKWCRFAIGGAIAGCIGYTYGTFAKVDSVLCAKVFAIASIAFLMLKACNRELNDRREMLADIIYLAAAITFPTVLNNLGLCSNIGAVALGTVLVAGLILNKVSS